MAQDGLSCLVVSRGWSYEPEPSELHLSVWVASVDPGSFLSDQLPWNLWSHGRQNVAVPNSWFDMYASSTPGRPKLALCPNSTSPEKRLWLAWVVSSKQELDDGELASL